MSLTLSHTAHGPGLRKALVVLAVGFAVSAPLSQALLGWGIDQREFSASGNETLRAAGYAFSIWSLIYAGLIAHAVAQLMDHSRREALFVALSPSIASIAGCGAWIIASGFDARWASVAIILVSAAAAVWALMRVRDVPKSLKDHLFSVWPMALLGGWLLIASAINVLTVMTAEGLIGPETRMGFALGGIVTVTGLAIAVMRAGVSVAYGLPVAWGFVAVFVAERGDQPTAAFAALAAAAVVLTASVWIELKRRAVR